MISSLASRWWFYPYFISSLSGNYNNPYFSATIDIDPWNSRPLWIDGHVSRNGRPHDWNIYLVLDSPIFDFTLTPLSTKLKFIYWRPAVQYLAISFHVVRRQLLVTLSIFQGCWLKDLVNFNLALPCSLLFNLSQQLWIWAILGVHMTSPFSINQTLQSSEN